MHKEHWWGVGGEGQAMGTKSSFNRQNLNKMWFQTRFGGRHEETKTEVDNKAPVEKQIKYDQIYHSTFFKTFIMGELLFRTDNVAKTNR